MMLKSRFVVPVNAPVIESGAVIIQDDRIVAAGPAGELSGSPVVDYGDAVICPAFVNAHTHLELSALAGRVAPAPDFTGWLKRLYELTRSVAETRESVQAAVRTGIEQSLAAGVTIIGDITRFPTWTRDVLAGSALRAVSFGEVIAVGKRRHLLTERLARAESFEHATQRLRVGISPHAPYTVEPDALRSCAERAAEIKCPLCVHLAETVEEDRFTRSGEGGLVEYLRAMEVWDEHVPVSGCGPVEVLRRTGLLTPTTVLAHANYVTDEDLDMIAASGASVAFCPRTHRAFGHPPHRCVEMLRRGINVCIGTDSLASAPSLSILDELRLLRREYPQLTADQIIAMGTINGARALGFGSEAGTLTAGNLADVVVIPLEHAGGKPRWERTFDSVQPPSAVYVWGEGRPA